MIVADTSSLISIASIQILDTFLEEFDVHTTETVVEELRETAEYEDRHAEAAQTVLQHKKQIRIHEVENPGFQSSRIDPGEATILKLSQKNTVDFLITDDLHALPELQTVADTQVAISPIVLKALTQRNKLEQEEAERKLRELAENRDWLNAPIYRRAQRLLPEEEK